ncbi:hypothetical protein ABH931_005637 [Streptacidiphilus sp. MAP12-33]|uniref:hypothetical protein n=1 Tax=Streptacidiphilus sp. MAP12-33 TaxID=3156266 RepID=UPI003517A9A8
MNQAPNGPDDEVREALAAAVGSYGPAVLGNAQMLGNILTDLLPDHPRERSLLVAAAEAEAATLLQEQVGQQRLDTGTAVALTSRTLMERRALDPAAARWVTTAYATALGYHPPPVAPPAPADVPPADAVPGAGPVGDATPYVPTQPMSSLPQPTPVRHPPIPDAPTLIAPPGAGSGSVPPAGSSWPPAPPGPPPGAQPGPGSYGSPLPGFGAPPGGGQGVPPQGFGPPGSASYPNTAFGGASAGNPPPFGYSTGAGGGGPKKRPAALIVAAAAVAALLVYLALAGATHLPPFQAAAAHPTHSPSPAPTTPSPSPTPTTPTPSPSPTGPVLADGITPLMDILSTALPDPATQCQTHDPSQDKFTSVGLVSAYYCTDTNLPGGGIWAYQLDTATDYQATWVNYNKWWGFSTSSAGSACPPGSGSSGGLNGWHDNAAGYPDRSGQVLECQMVGTSGGTNNQPSYTWSLPTQNTFFVAEGAKGTSWSALNDWWAKYAPPQPASAASPTSS